MLIRFVFSIICSLINCWQAYLYLISYTFDMKKFLSLLLLIGVVGCEKDNREYFDCVIDESVIDKPYGHTLTLDEDNKKIAFHGAGIVNGTFDSYEEYGEVIVGNYGKWKGLDGLNVNEGNVSIDFNRKTLEMKLITFDGYKTTKFYDYQCK